MKDLSAHTSKPSRNSFYTKKRPSPHGVAKRKSPFTAVPPPVAATRTCHTSTTWSRVRSEIQRQRDAHILALGKEAKLCEAEYRADVLDYMHEMERLTMSSVTSMDQQPEVRWHMRPCLVDFLVEVHLNFRLRPETLYLTLNIIDRYVSRRVVYLKHYQLVGCVALWIAAKFEDAQERVPSVKDLSEICRQAYHHTAFVQMEQHVLTTLQWIVGHPTAESWLRSSSCEIATDDPRTQHVARFVMEITLFYREFVSFYPSDIAAGALALARCICSKTRYPADESDESLDIAELLDTQLASHLDDLSEVIVKKYAYAFYSKASSVVIQFYLSSKRFVRHPVPPALVIPARTPLSSLTSVRTPLSASTSYSSASSDDMPSTPSSGSFYGDPFCSASVEMRADQKENSRPTSSSTPTLAFRPVIKRPSAEDMTSCMLPDNHVVSRPVLHVLNGIPQSPRIGH
ncbi:hypothetical protein SISNIDRAFT_455082 [Sistotremastrum niveocremeum HHB9708]|uniref:Uncharacterized protein n=1 Tax=Sistotremastrum niveocremeum HHB9708 TaxID=1314777 RepID=A0A164UCL0_9AGAM|nr:hypothetical protein SISNIDRAFT_455082 [Sistotremastrum niveocremeum HHB9708]